tara:strand:- start:8096 stop:9007 length:912 start_codon:yes stop_codon:yes gene_type:complete
MSTLATNKLGTLAGTADMSLPKTRPSSTLNAQLDSSGNLSFAADTATVNFFAAEDDGKVGMVLVDSQSFGKDGLTTQFTQPNQTVWKTYYGINVGYFNAPASVQTNYLFPGNVRYYIYEGSFINMGDGQASLRYGDLTRDAENLFGNNGNADPSSQIRAYVYGPSGYNNANGSGGQNNSGGFARNYPQKEIGYQASTGPASISQFKLIQKVARNAGYCTSGVQSYMPNDDSSSYAPVRGAWQWRTRSSSTTSTSNFDAYGYPGSSNEPGGISFGQDNVNEGNRFAYFNVQCYAVIKPTPVVAE